MADFSSNMTSQAAAFALIESTGVGSLAGIRAASAKRMSNAPTGKAKYAAHRAATLKAMRGVVANLVDAADKKLDERIRASLISSGFSQEDVAGIDADWKEMVLAPEKAASELANLKASGSSLDVAFATAVKPVLDDIVARRNNYVASFKQAK